ncbi:MAG: FGGY-family carbohydrate kinase, partial [Actinomycetota bacterium]
RCADLVEATIADTGLRLDGLRVDGGMTANGSFLRALADITGLPIQRSAELEATTLGAGLLAGAALGMWSSVEEASASWRPAEVIEAELGDEPRGQLRARWLEARARAEQSIPELSGLEF